MKAFHRSILAALAFLTVSASRAEDLRYHTLVLDMVYHNPGEPRFVTKFNHPALLKTWGYNGQCPKLYVQAALTYDSFDPVLLPKGSAERVWSEKQAAFNDEQLREAQASQMPLYPFTDMLVVPKSLMDKYGDQMKIDGRLSILQPMTQLVVREQITEIFDRFPALGGITVRFGETYLHDTPFHVGGSPVSSIEEHQTLINLLRNEVCVKHGKKLIYRTWSWGGAELHTNPTNYLKVTAAIEPHTNLFFSIKHSNADFLRGVPFNQTLGIGGHRQIVEVSCNQAGVYGKNAHPYYIGQGVIEGWEEMGDHKKGLRDLIGSKQLAGVWTWTRGDGWAGPYPPNEFWVDLNAWVISHFAQEPWKTESELFQDYCHQILKLDNANTAKFRELCLLATSATFHGQQSLFFKANPWWCRDEYLTAINLEAVVQTGIIKEVLAEKAKAVADWRRVEALAREIRLSNSADQKFLEVSATYGRIKFELIEQIWTMQILAAKENLEGYLDKASLHMAIESYDQLWREWRQLKKDHACCPTLYKDDFAVHCSPPFKTLLELYRDKVKTFDVKMIAR